MLVSWPFTVQDALTDSFGPSWRDSIVLEEQPAGSGCVAQVRETPAASFSPSLFSLSLPLALCLASSIYNIQISLALPLFPYVSISVFLFINALCE